MVTERTPLPFLFIMVIGNYFFERDANYVFGIVGYFR